MLSANTGAHVSIMLHIDEEDGPCQLSGKSTDDVVVRVSTDGERVSARGWMEIIGRPTGAGAIRATEVIVFESDPAATEAAEAFDAASHNMLVHFLNNKSEAELFMLK